MLLRRILPRAGVAASLVIACAVFSAPAAGAAITSSRVLTPTDPAFSMFNDDLPNPIAVVGSTSGGSPGDEVDLLCFYNGGSAHKVLASNVATDTDGSFSVPAADLSTIEDRVCRLRAVPAGSTVEDPAFVGPLMATGDNEYSRISGSTNDGLAYDYYLWGQQLTAAADYQSLGGCGLRDAYLFDSNLTQTTRTFACNDWFAAGDNTSSPVLSDSSRSEIQVDGTNAYAPLQADFINEEASPGFPQVAYDYTLNSQNGDLLIRESEPLVRCPNAGYPPTSTRCPSFVATGLRVDRTIVQSNDGHLITIIDSYTSTDGLAHSLDLLPQNNQSFGGSDDIAYEFPGQGAYSTRSPGDSVSFADQVPATVLIDVRGSPDGDHSTGRGAIVVDQPASPATFSSASAFHLHQTATVPGGGAITFRTAYAQAYAQADLDTLVKQAVDSFTPAPPPVTLPSNRFKFRKVTLKKHKGIARIQLKVPGPGQLTLTGHQIKIVKRKVTRAGYVTLTVRPKRKLKQKVKHHRRLSVRIRVTYIPTGGLPRTTAKSLTLVHQH